MKKLLFSRTARYATIFLLLLAFSVTFTSCVVRPPHHSERRKLPPGHEKKITWRPIGKTLRTRTTKKATSQRT